MNRRRLLLALVALCLGAGAIAGVPTSGATYTDTSTYAATVGAANDWTPPSVTITDPGSTVSGSTTLTATAGDARGAVTSVAFQYAPAGSSSWTTVCTDSASPWSCSWATTGVSDGAYQLRALATDDSANAAASATVSTTVANDGSVTLGDPGSNLAGMVWLSADASSVSGGATYVFSYAAAGTTSWSTACTFTWWYSPMGACSWNTSGLTGSYDLRVVATARDGSTRTDLVRDRVIDNSAPTNVSLDVPGTLHGQVSLVATGHDTGSGIASLAVQQRTQGNGSWSTCGTGTGSPYTCSLDAAGLADGTYEFRAVATDRAGNQTVSSTVTRSVDHSFSSVAVTSPSDGATVRGSVTVSASASSSKGVRSVRFEVRLPGSSSWMEVCSDTNAPYSCTADTTPVQTSTVDLRAVMVDNAWGTTTSDAVTIQVDNRPLRGQDVQVVASGGTGRPSTGDKIVFTYSEKVSTGSIKSGWNGSATTIAPTFYDRSAWGSADGSRDNVALDGTNLGDVTFAQNYLDYRHTATFTGSTMVASTQTVGGVQVTVVTVTLGNTSDSLRNDTSSGAMVWSPSSSVRTTDGRGCSTDTVTESGSSDRDF